MIVKSKTHSYQVGNQVAGSGKYNLYLCMQGETGRQCLLQIAVDTAHNGELDRAAFLLGELKRHSDALEKEYAEVRTDPKDILNYCLCFPELVDSFVCQEQGKRRINILAFRSVEDVGKMVPLGNITAKYRHCVDLRTSAWIMGKSLKLLVFAHSLGISFGRVNGSKILINPDEHYVVFFDWSGAQMYPDIVPEEKRRNEISQSAQAIITVLGGSYEDRFIPNDGTEGFNRYADHLFNLAGGIQHNAESAHLQFYTLIDETWEGGFHPFVSHPLT